MTRQGEAIPSRNGDGSRERPLRLMIVDDSIVARSILARTLEGDARFRVVASASSADQALPALNALSVDIILLDVAMPGTDGLTALPEILRRSRGARVLIVSSAASEGADACVRALTLGAADTLLKPVAGAIGGQFAQALTDKLLRIGPAEAGGDMPAPAEPAASAHAPRFATRATVAGPIACLGIGASTGGPHALSAFFAALPDWFRAPILVTQHLPAPFMPYFAAQLQQITRRPTAVAANGAALKPGEILVAPGGAHMGLVQGTQGPRVQLSLAPQASACLPSVDPMFEGLATCFGAAAFGVVLTGMGRDGATGAARLAAAGAEILVQDRTSSVVWGMPGAVAMAGHACGAMPVEAIAQRIGRRSAAAGAQRSGMAAWR